jgi:hypothetical protein
MEKENQSELKTPSQALKLLKEDLKNHAGFNSIVEQGFINIDRFYTSAYDIIKDNFRVTKKVFILDEQIDVILGNEVNLSISETMTKLIDNGLVDITGVDSKGQLTYKLSNLGSQVHEYLNKADVEETKSEEI